MKKTGLFYSLTVLGIALIAGGIIILKTVGDPQGAIQTLPYVMIGLGCGIFGHGFGEIISRAAMKKHPELAQQNEINKTDERNVTIANRAKAKAYDAMLFIFGALIIALALMNIDRVVVLLLVFAYLFVTGIGIYYRCKFDKEL